ncbi:hypothetical protein BDR04DRAFT_1122826 [Suillus decipiens]|nr:hypothetical protein BDR04DRAFT_1122826 [Suillus decipiens]
MITVDPEFRRMEWKTIWKLIQDPEDVVDRKLTCEVRKISDLSESIGCGWKHEYNAFFLKMLIDPKICGNDSGGAIGVLDRVWWTGSRHVRYGKFRIDLKGSDIRKFPVGASEGLWSSSEDMVGWILTDPIRMNSEFRREAKQIQEFRRVEIETSQTVVVDENSVEWIWSRVDVEVMYFMKKPSEDRRLEVSEDYRWV